MNTLDIQTRVAMHDTDACGMVYFANFFRYAEAAETHALEATLGEASANLESYRFPRVHAECDYLAPLRFRDEVTVSPSLTAIGNTSLRWQFIISTSRGPAAIVRAVSSRRFPDDSPAPFSEAEKTALAPLLKPSRG